MAVEVTKERYFRIANIVLLLIGIIIILLAIYVYSSAPWNDVLLNIGSDIVVVSVLFFLGHYLLFDPQSVAQKEIVKKIDELSSSLGGGRPSCFMTRSEANTEEDLAQFVHQAQEVFVGGVALRSAGRSYFGLYKELLNKGVRLRFMLLDPESYDVKEIAKQWGVQPQYIANDIRTTLAALQNLQIFAQKIGKGHVEIRVQRREPVFSFLLRDPGKPTAKLRADLRVYGLDLPQRPVWELEPKDKV